MENLGGRFDIGLTLKFAVKIYFAQNLEEEVAVAILTRI